MRIDIISSQFCKSIEITSQTDLIGITVFYKNDRRCSVLDFEANGIEKWDEEILINADVKVIVHHYIGPKLAEIVKEFDGFKKMKYSEHRWKDLYIAINI